MQQYLDYSESRHVKKTFEEKKTVFIRFYKFLKSKKMSEYSEMTTLTIPLCFEYLQLQYKNRSGNSANKERKNLAAAYTWVTRYLKYHSNINPFLAVEKFPEKKEPRYIPSANDFWKAYHACTEQQDRVMLLTFLYTAGRRNEIFNLKWNDINFVDQTISLKTRKREQGNFEIDIIPMI